MFVLALALCSKANGQSRADDQTHRSQGAQQDPATATRDLLLRHGFAHGRVECHKRKDGLQSPAFCCSCSLACGAGPRFAVEKEEKVGEGRAWSCVSVRSGGTPATRIGA